MEKAKKDALVSDIENYLSSACKKYYANRGIPNRRGYPFFGPPGTGKTSFAVALASHFSLPIFLLGMSDPELNDRILDDLLSQLPSRSMLLLEDVDSAELQCENMANSSDANNSQDLEGILPVKRNLTLSGLLNALNGPASVDGRVLFMASVLPDSLDAALARPGRCDVKVLLSYVRSAEVAQAMFPRIYTTSADETYKGETSPAGTMDIPAMAEEFASKVPLDAPITPAELRAWLLLHRLIPEAHSTAPRSGHRRSSITRSEAPTWPASPTRLTSPRLMRRTLLRQPRLDRHLLAQTEFMDLQHYQRDLMLCESQSQSINHCK